MSRRLRPLLGRPVHPHTLRHSFASRLRAAGAGIELIQECLGHKSIMTTVRYSHLTTAERAASLEAFLSADPRGS